MADLKMEGLADLSTLLAGFPDRLVKNSLRAGMRQAANIVKAQAQANFDGAAPHPNAITGALRASIRVTQRRGTPTRVVFNVVAGSLTSAQVKKLGADSPYYALWVERGHINRALGEALRGSRESVKAVRAASTSNTPAHPFMAPAIEAKAQAAINVLAETVTAKLLEDVQ